MGLSFSYADPSFRLRVRVRGKTRLRSREKFEDFKTVLFSDRVLVCIGAIPRYFPRRGLMVIFTLLLFDILSPLRYMISLRA
jgi:hypothetical protein